MNSKKITFSSKVQLFLILFSTVFIIISWLSTSFSDWYTDNIFPIWINTYGRFTSLFPFSVGEIMIFAGVLWLAILLVFLLILLVMFFSCLFKKNTNFFHTPNVIKKYLKATSWILTIVYLIMNLNCFVLYHCTQIPSNQSYTLEDLTLLRDHIVTILNESSTNFDRDDSGNIIYSGDMQEEAILSLQNLSGSYPRAKGYQVTPKILASSVFMSQQYMQGYYFPFSMEANINGLMSIGNKPFTMCHELAHTRGYIYEDEANLIGFFACINSDDAFFKYSGYLSVLNYVNNAFYKSVDLETYKSHIKVSDLVWYDDEFLTSDAWNYVNSHSLFSTETVKEAADTFVDTSLKVNGVKEGKLSYDHVVDLLITYYDYN